MKKAITNLALVLLFIAGLGVALYPTISDQFNLYRASLLINRYESKAIELTPEDYSELIEACQSYNQGLLGGTVPDVFSIHSEEASPEYMALLNLNGDGVMGTVEIPKIGVKIPIFHTTFDDVLQNGAGHMEGSSLPIGGESTHTVLAAHRGLPSAKLFTDLDLVELGDMITLNVLGDYLIYQVEEIQIVEPIETESLAIVEGRDLITLVTCTPYAINTHRLLVRGTRVFPEDIAQAIVIQPEAAQLDEWKSLLVFSIPVFIVLILLFSVIFRKRR